MRAYTYNDGLTNIVVNVMLYSYGCQLAQHI